MNSAVKPQRVFFMKESFLPKMPAIFLALIFLYTFEKNSHRKIMQVSGNGTLIAHTSQVKICFRENKL